MWLDVALGGLSGITSQPNFNAIVEMMKYAKRAHEPLIINKLNDFLIFGKIHENYIILLSLD